MIRSKKSEAGLTIIVIVIIAVLFVGWIINLSQRECKSNKDCGSEAYCGSDFSCHSYPTIQKTVVQYNFLIPSIIIGLAVVIASIILRWVSIMHKDETKQVVDTASIIMEKSPEEVEEISEPYYKSGNNIKMP